jgi:L-fuconolactonase
MPPAEPAPVTGSGPAPAAPSGAGPGPVTDAHLHLWDLGASPYAWLAGAPAPLRRTVTIDEVREGLLDLGVDRVVLVQADDTAEDTAHLQRTARAIEADGRIRRADVVGWLPLTDPATVEAALADPEHTDHLVGVRHLVHDDPDPGLLDRPEVALSLELLAGAGLPLDVPDAFERHTAQVVRVARRHPGLTIVLDHLGKPPLGDPGAMARWAEQLAEIAACPNTVAKVSGLATSGDGDFAEAVELARRLFGADRLMIGSDWPIAPRAHDLSGGFAPLLAHVRAWEAAEVAAVTHRTAARVYRRLGESVATD